MYGGNIVDLKSWNQASHECPWEVEEKNYSQCFPLWMLLIDLNGYFYRSSECYLSFHMILEFYFQKCLKEQISYVLVIKTSGSKISRHIVKVFAYSYQWCSWKLLKKNIDRSMIEWVKEWLTSKIRFHLSQFVYLANYKFDSMWSYHRPSWAYLFELLHVGCSFTYCK